MCQHSGGGVMILACFSATKSTVNSSACPSILVKGVICPTTKPLKPGSNWVMQQDRKSEKVQTSTWPIRSNTKIPWWHDCLRNHLQKKGHQFCNKTQTRTFLTKTTPAMFLTGAVDAKYKPRKKLQVLKWKGMEVPSAQATIWVWWEGAVTNEKSAYVSTYEREKKCPDNVSESSDHTFISGRKMQHCATLHFSVQDLKVHMELKR